MSIFSPKTSIFNTTVNVYRKGFSVSDVGDFSESPSLLLSNLPANIQPKQSELVYEMEGASHYQTHVCYLSGGSSISVDDLVKDTETGLSYTVVAVEGFSAANSSVTSTHHTRLSLEAINSGPSTSTEKTLASKARVSAAG